MAVRRRSWLTSILAGGVVIGLGGPQDARAAGQTTLARSVPGDARLFLELRSPRSLLDVPIGLALSRLLTTQPAPATQPDAGTQPAASAPAATQTAPASRPASAAAVSRPAADWNWRGLAWPELFAEAVGLDHPKATALLFTGPVALAAESWSGLGDAILLAEPRDAAGLEAALGERRDPGSAGAKVRRYRLGRDHELACDGRIAVIGGAAKRSGLYARTVEILASDQGVSLDDVAEFRERTAGLPAGAQLVLYAGANSRQAGSSAPLGRWWPESWPQLRSLAAAVVVDTTGLVIEANGRLESQLQRSGGLEAPVQSLLRMPASALATWTQEIDFVEWFRQLQAAYPEGVPVLGGSLPPADLEAGLLRHLVGDSVLTLGQFKYRTPDMGPGEADMLLPAMVLAVETDDPHTVEATMERLTNDFLASLRPRLPSEGQTPLEHTPIEAGGRGIVSVPVGEVLWSRSGCPVFRSLQLSWVVADRWLIVGTHAETVREMVQARRDPSPALPTSVIPEAMRQAGKQRPGGEMLLLARPRMASEMVRSWVSYVDRHHPEMLRPEWWQNLWRKQRLAGVQLGIRPKVGAAAGRVEVGQTMSGYPAYGRLKADDQIVAVEGRPLDAQHPLASLSRMVATRPHDDRVTVRIVRDKQELEVAIPMAAPGWQTARIQPVQLLEQAAAVLRLFGSATYAVWQPSAELMNARLELRFARFPPATRSAAE